MPVTKGCISGTGMGRFDFPRVPKGLSVENPDPGELSGQIKKMAKLFGASLCGICKRDNRWIYSAGFEGSRTGGSEIPINIPEEYTHVIALAFEMDYEAIATSPAHPASVATGMGYSRMVFTSAQLAQYIRGLGFKAIPCGNDTALSIPIAIDAGLGEIARNGLLITPQYGPRVRLAKIFTTMPLIPDEPIEFGVWDFCVVCEKCADRCPSKSIMRGLPTGEPFDCCNQSNILKWNIKATKCLSFWVSNGTDCSNCIRVCPFNKPDGLLHDLVRFGIRRFKSLHSVFLLGDDVLGYGKRQKAETFWR
jgi:epoxyqueuosine reductase